MLTSEQLAAEADFDAFGRYLRNHGQRGVAKDAGNCPVANYFRFVLPEQPFRLLAVHHRVSAYVYPSPGQLERISASLPDPFARFITAIDLLHPRGGRVGYREALTAWQIAKDTEGA